MITNIRTGDVTFENAVLGFEVKCERIMSDVYADVRYAIVWDGEKIQNVAVGNGEFGASDTAIVDATDEVKAAAALYLHEQEVKRLNYDWDYSVNRTIDAARVPARGKDVKVVRGRKVPIGTTGRVFWSGNNGYGESVGIETADGDRVFTASKNVEVTNVDDYLDIDALMARPNFEVRAAKAAASRLMVIMGRKAA